MAVLEKIKKAYNDLVNPYKEQTELVRQVKESLDLIGLIRMHFVSEFGDFIDFKGLIADTNHYTSFSQKISVRMQEHADHFNSVFERSIYGKYTHKMNYSTGTVLLNTCLSGSKVNYHYHLEDEVLLVAFGRCTVELIWLDQDSESVTLDKGDSIFIPKLTPHAITSIPTDTYIMANLVPKLPALIKP